MSDYAVDAPPPGGAVRPASAAPYAEAMGSLGIETAEPALTPIQQALQASAPQQQPYASAPPQNGYQFQTEQYPGAPQPAATEGAGEAPAFGNPYADPAPPEAAEGPADPMDALSGRLEQLQAAVDAVLLRDTPQPQAAPPAPPNLTWDGSQWVPVQEQTPAFPTFDPYDEHSVARWQQEFPSYLAQRDQHIAQTVAQSVVEAFAPITDVLETVAEERGEQAAKDYFEQLKPHVGNFDPDLAYVVAQAFTKAGAEPQDALVEAARYAHEYNKNQWDQWASERGQTAAQVAAAPTAVSAAPAAASEIAPVHPGERGYRQVAEQFRGLRLVV